MNVLWALCLHSLSQTVYHTVVSQIKLHVCSTSSGHSQHVYNYIAEGHSGMMLIFMSTAHYHQILTAIHMVYQK